MLNKKKLRRNPKRAYVRVPFFGVFGQKKAVRWKASKIELNPDREIQESRLELQSS
jgi:hypothetical protein